jgi:hypothetical protein
MSLDRKNTNRAMLMLRAAVGSARAEGGGGEAAAGYQRLIDTIDKARAEGGSVTLLCGDDREDTIREEAWHAWQRQNHVHDSDAVRVISQRPEVREIVSQLEDMGYGKGGGVQGRTEIALELMAKTLGGDPDLVMTAEERHDLSYDFLRAVVFENGPGVLRDAPPVDPEAEAAPKDARRSYEREPNAGGNGETPRGNSGSARSPGDKGNGSGRDSLHPRLEAKPAGGGSKSGVRGASEEEGELGPSYQRRRGETPPSLALPGMEGADADRAAEAGEYNAELLSEEMRKPKGDISATAGRMERESPLFWGAGEKPALFLHEISA